MLADENCLRQFAMGEMLSQGMTLNQDELLSHSALKIVLLSADSKRGGSPTVREGVNFTM